MPYPYLTELPIWVSSCGQGVVGATLPIQNGLDDNCILQVNSGRCMVICNNERRSLSARSVLFLGRNTSAELLGDPDQECRYTMLTYHNVQSAPYLDLNRLCLTAPLIDSFFAQKTRFCTLEDRQYINVTLGELRYEWENRLSEWKTAIRGAMENLFVKLARSFHSQYRFAGVRYLTEAKNYIFQNFQQSITVESIADAVGISRSYLEALFNRYMRGSIVDYLHAVRCDHAAQLLSTTGFPIIDIAMDSGFTNRQHFARVFRVIYGSTPSEYRKRNEHGAVKIR
ncbi:MAG TPA: AraC family transcriptional regulator [Candidatus Limiplasma sp.]|nr:AraC family transcriptional regulator [Candidatus Limiplasma sp.]HPR77022.1 AraC family transcriptional regulator [Candidatus Limiplasma sp.]